jgi:hypothetical protein
MLVAFAVTWLRWGYDAATLGDAAPTAPTSVQSDFRIAVRIRVLVTRPSHTTAKLPLLSGAAETMSGNSSVATRSCAEVAAPLGSSARHSIEYVVVATGSW